MIQVLAMVYWKTQEFKMLKRLTYAYQVDGFDEIFFLRFVPRNFAELDSSLNYLVWECLILLSLNRFRLHYTRLPTLANFEAAIR